MVGHDGWTLLVVGTREGLCIGGSILALSTKVVYVVPFFCPRCTHCLSIQYPWESHTVKREKHMGQAEDFWSSNVH